MPMQRLMVRPYDRAVVDDRCEAQLYAAAAIDFLGETSESSSSDCNVPLPCGEGVLAGNVWKFGGGGVMVAAAVEDGGWGQEAAVRVVRLRDLEALSLSVQNETHV
jgi:hypothetical protein